jgi:hypothetical protein
VGVTYGEQQPDSYDPGTYIGVVVKRRQTASAQ